MQRLSERHESRILEPLRGIVQTQGRCRERLVKQLFGELSKHVPTWIRDSPGQPARVPSAELDDVVTHATEHLVLAVLRGSSPFRGSTEAEARGWCRKVVRNSASGQWRKYRRQQAARIELVPSNHATASNCEAERLLAAAITVLEYEIIQKTRQSFVRTVREAFRCFIEGRLGASEGETPLTGQPVLESRRRWLLYQRRRRGKQAAQRAYARLASQGIDDELASVMLVLVGPISRPKRLGGASVALPSFATFA